MIFPLTGVEPGPVKVKVVPLSVDGSIALLNVALIPALGAEVAPLAGVMSVIAGAVLSGPTPVVKVQVCAIASGFPAKSLAAVVIVAVNKTPVANALVGVNVAVAPISEYVTVPGTGVIPGPVRLKVNPVMVAESIGSLKVAVTFWLVATVGARSAGIVEMTVGATVSEAAPVTKVQTKLLASGTRAALSAPVVIVTVIVVPVGSGALGVKIAILLVTS